MRGPSLSCPQAAARSGEPIRCEKTGNPCGFQYFKRCKGWWTMSDNAAGCRLRKEEEENHA